MMLREEILDNIIHLLWENEEDCTRDELSEKILSFFENNGLLQNRNYIRIEGYESD